MGRYVFKLPDVGEGTAEAEIVAWHVAVGDRVEEDQQLVDVMTDKATVEMTSPVNGTIVALKGEPGQMAAVGAPLVEFELEAAQAPAVAASGPAKPPADEPAQRPLAAPAVRLRAADLGIDLHKVRGTGPAGRVTHGDVDDFLAAAGAKPAAKKAEPAAEPIPRPAPKGEFEDVKLIGLRRRIAEKMQEAKRRIPHFGYVEEVDMTELESLRAHLNQSRRADQPKLTVLPFLMRAMVCALPEFPQVNAHFDDEAGTVRRFAAVHIGIATQTDAGLMVPVVRNAERLDLRQAAAEVARMSGLARENKASKDDLTGSTITITSLGALGGLATMPIINHPEVAIIGPNAIVERPVVLGGQISVRKMMNLSSAFDHRVVDGADAARFVRRLKELLEHPALLFMEPG
ncbi:MAG TPA: dihydrolipoamide acetyltransferase family protein [Rhizomicrobium sp.]|nr:dihydrolipoamide acetyltransferase family protein [Rhizomicrobium sp.]